MTLAQLAEIGMRPRVTLGSRLARATDPHVTVGTTPVTDRVVADDVAEVVDETAEAAVKAIASPMVDPIATAIDARRAVARMWMPN